MDYVLKGFKYVCRVTRSSTFVTTKEVPPATKSFTTLHHHNGVNMGIMRLDIIIRITSEFPDKRSRCLIIRTNC